MTVKSLDLSSKVLCDVRHKYLISVNSEVLAKDLVLTVEVILKVQQKRILLFVLGMDRYYKVGANY